MECLKADYTEVWTRADVVPLIRFADRVRSLASTGIDLLGLEGIDPPQALLDQLRGFDSIVSWYGSNREEFRDEVRRLGLPFEFFPALPATAPQPRAAGERVHAADFFMAQAGCVGRAVPRIDCVSAPAEDFAVMHPFSGSPRKNWPLDRFRELAESIGMPVRWSAGPEEDLEGAVRIGDLYELACWIRSARIYIGNDSGITHLAAAAGARVVAIFGPTDPAVWAPRGDRVRVVAGELDEVRVEQVLHDVRELLLS
jgi:heptosyltransferase-3